MKKNIALILSILFTLNTFSIIAQEVDSLQSLKPENNDIPTLKIGDIRDGSLSKSIHNIKLYDESGFVIHKDDDLLLPFSTKNSCGECHSYELIKNGSHFNISAQDSSKNRNGEPYIFFDPYTLTTIPISFKGWKNTFRPDDINLSPMEFLDKFGTHFTGGDISENETIEHPENFFRWDVSGKLEINCLLCHDASPEFNHSEYANQIKKQNYRWAATASNNLAEVKGSAKDMPDNFDVYNVNTYIDKDLRVTSPPTVLYDLSKFNVDSKVFFNIKREVPNENCYYCHSSVVADNNIGGIHQEDVHLKAGMNCVDCHGNDMDHNMTVGYENEILDYASETPHRFTCEGCHVGNEYSAIPYSGSFGAPRPSHKGIPSIHFERLTCTVCHSATWPVSKTKYVKTSRAHKLGSLYTDKSVDTNPKIQSPVLVENLDGKIELRNLVWPSYWVEIKEDEIIYSSIEIINNKVRSILNFDTLLVKGIIPKIAKDSLAGILNFYQVGGDSAVQLGLITGGKLYSSNNNELVSKKVEIGEPYTWPIAHKVRPASQALGVRGCDDCHSLNSDFFNSEVKVETIFEQSENKKISMAHFENLSPFYQNAFSLTFFFRPVLKFIIIVSFLTILLTLMTFISRGILSISKYSSEQKSDIGGN